MPRIAPKKSAKENKVAAEQRKRSAAIDAIDDAFKGFKRADQVLTVVKSVPTIFVQVDHAIRVGGWPIERIETIHGGSNEGKTIFILGLAKSFLMRDHFVYFADAERTTSSTWVKDLLGGYFHHPRFRAIKPDSYEHARSRISEFLNTMADVRKKDSRLACLVLLDSIQKLTPAKFIEKLADSEKKDAAGGRAAMIKAGWNTAWMDELVPLCEKANASFSMIAREYQKPDAGMYEEDYVVGGGRGVVYDSSVRARIERAAWVKIGEGKTARVVGERHRVTIKKTKVGGKDGKTSVAFFHTSNGQHVPFGFDVARDVLELAQRFGLSKVRGNPIDGKEFSEEVLRLTSTPEALAELEAEVRQSFAGNAPTEHDPETGEVIE